MQFEEDSFLVLKIKEGNFEAFEVLYNRYKKKLYAFSYKYLKNHSDAEELLQVIFVSLWDHRKSLNGSLSVRNYLYRCATNKIYDHLRKIYVHNKFVEHQGINERSDNNTTIDDIYYKDLKESIDLLMEDLPPQQKNIFFLSRYKYLSNKDIAEKLDLSVRTVETQIYNVIKTFKRKLML